MPPACLPTRSPPETMTRTLYLHIGTHRTATSSLQAYLYDNRPRLRRQGFLYPFNVRRHVALMDRLFAGHTTPERVASRINALADKRGGIHSAILSDEDICSRPDLSLLARFREHFDVKVLYCLRRQDLWLESWHLQNIKWQWNPELSHMGWRDFLAGRERFHWIRYDAYMRHLEDVFGSENVIPYVYEKGQMPEGPMAAFCDRIGLTDRSDFTEPRHMNASRSTLVSEFMRHLPLDEVPPRYRSKVERACAALDIEVSNGRQEKAPLLMGPLRRRRVMADYAPGNRELARRRFGRNRLFLDPLPDWSASVTRPRLPARSEAVMDDLVAPFLRELMRQWQEEDLRRQENAQSGKGGGAA